MDDLYRDYILDHYRNPRNRGNMVNPDVSYEDANPLCGDKIRIELKVKDGTIEKAMFTGHGCAISQASASMLTEQLEGMTLAEASELTRNDVLENLGIEAISPARLKCALLSLKVFRHGITVVGGKQSDEDDEDE